MYNHYRMGRNSIERGSRDTWTANPRRDADVATRVRGPEAMIWSAQHAPEYRDPGGYIISSDQADVPTVIKFINSLRETGITIQRATSAFSVAGKQYPAGSFVVTAAQAFRPHVMDMFEPQVHPDVFPYPGSAPTPPYDNAGWTLAFQMGIQFDRVLDAFTGPFENVADWNVPVPKGIIATASGAKGFITSPRTNESYTAVNRLLKGNERVVRLTDTVTVNGKKFAPGAVYIAALKNTAAALQAISTSLGLNFDGVKTAAPVSGKPMHAVRVGLWDNYGGSMPSGWTRWILEQYEFRLRAVAAVVVLARVVVGLWMNRPICPLSTRDNSVACRRTRRFRSSENS